MNKAGSPFDKLHPVFNAEFHFPETTAENIINAVISYSYLVQLY